MRNLPVTFCLLAASILTLPWHALALDGQVQIHDPSTVVHCGGKYYTFGTGGTTLVSEDGWTWVRGVKPSRSGMAPDIIHVGGRYYMYVARNVGAQPRAEINMIWSKTLDPNSPEYQWEEGGVVASSDGIEDCNAIDPGLLLDATDGRLWLTYVRCAVINGGGATDFCARFLDAEEKPLRNFTIQLGQARK